MIPKVPVVCVKNDFKHETKFLETFQENQEFYAWQFHLKLQKRREYLRRLRAKRRPLSDPYHSN